jgi:hypothetical protein
MNHELDEAIAELNQEWAMVFERGRVRVRRTENGKPVFYSVRDFTKIYQNRKIQTSPGRFESLGKLWLDAKK